MYKLCVDLLTFNSVVIISKRVKRGKKSAPSRARELERVLLFILIYLKPEKLKLHQEKTLLPRLLPRLLYQSTTRTTNNAIFDPSNRKATKKRPAVYVLPFFAAYTTTNEPTIPFPTETKTNDFVDPN